MQQIYTCVVGSVVGLGIIGINLLSIKWRAGSGFFVSEHSSTVLLKLFENGNVSKMDLCSFADLFNDRYFLVSFHSVTAHALAIQRSFFPELTFSCDYSMRVDCCEGSQFSGLHLYALQLYTYHRT